MKHLILLCLIFLTVWTSVTSKSIQKRQACSNGCGSCSSGCSNSCSTPTCTSCSAPTCNTCVTQCSNNCNTQSCRNSCVNDCNTKCNDCKEKEVVSNSEQPVIIESPEPSIITVNNTNYNLINLTTLINIDNIVNNYNNISVPIYVNTTNINNIEVNNIENKTEGGSTVIIHRNESERGGQIIPYPYPQPQPHIPQNDNCCYIMHPRRCYTDVDENKRCYIRRHRECGNSCTSPVVTIQEDEEQTNSGCYYTQNYPYVYCGNYVRRDCGQCYNCNGNYNPSECSRGGDCPDVCRRSIPNCVPSQSGLQCY